MVTVNKYFQNIFERGTGILFYSVLPVDKPVVVCLLVLYIFISLYRFSINGLQSIAFLVKTCKEYILQCITGFTIIFLFSS